MPENHLLIIALSNHSNLGPLLIPYFAREVSPGVISVEEQVSHAGKKNNLSELERQIIAIAESYSEKNLMKVYSKERTVTGFLKSVTTDMRQKLLRPFIDKKIRQMIRLMQIHKIPVYNKEAGVKLLYEHDRVLFFEHVAEVSFRFEITEQTFRYTAICKMNGEEISLQQKRRFMVFSSKPAVLFLDSHLLVFKRIEAARLVPFRFKRYVEVPVAELNKYMEKVVLPLISDYPAIPVGFDIIRESRACVPELSVERSINDDPVLQLHFRYGDHSFSPGQEPRYAYPSLKEEEGKPVVYYFVRDIRLEQTYVDLLKQWGFRQVSDTQFARNDLEGDHTFVDWLQQHRQELQACFSFVKKETSLSFYFGEVSLTQEIASSPDWFDIRITVRIGDYQFPFIRFKKNILEGKREFILPDGQIALLPEDWFEKYSDLFALGDGKQEEIRVRKMHLGLVAALEEGQDSIQKEYVRKESVAVPPKIKATLRPYQQEGFSWLVHLAANGFGGCLADDMGLGKTLQTISLLQHVYDPSEPVCIEYTPVSSGKVTVDQDGQFSFFSEGLPVETEHDTVNFRVETQQNLPATLIVVPTSLLPNWKREIRKFSSLSVYSYTAITEQKRKDPCKSFSRYNIVLITYGLLRRDIDLLENYRFTYVILDESQNVKNPASATYHAVVRLKSDHRLVLTGTPIENSLKDLWAQFNFINPSLLGSSDGFRKHFILPITKEGNEKVGKRLQQIIRPFFLRRTKLQVAPELPPLTEEVIYCEMTPEQREIYLKEKNVLRNTILQERNKNSFVALNGITRLRQLANHPQMVMPVYMGGSGKMEQILDAFETLVSEGHKVLIFSSFVTHLNLLARAFIERQWKYAMLTGSTLDREKEITRFSTQSDVSAFFISLKAGGVGLNLTDADYVFIIDPWWNPAAELQAEGRAHRIGQEKQVFVYRFITADTIEEKIRNLQESKSELAETFISENDPLKLLTDREWEELL
ncbi:DEAD/DEAH box helicase [uncultured Parabacteroides sp.]|uniref:DEAD/DEAH box helicase n=1 Tax=uncultured Parabacteroides sp. TaxID=512312 RepID=UPI0025910EF4|nr:DEAD/DEAH box helicase [uncultured Parabacteroides sp.]